MKIFLKNSRSAFVLIHDVAVAGMAWLMAYQLRFNFDIPHEYFAQMTELAWIVLPIQGVIFIGLGLYRGAWRFASLPDLKRIFFGVSISTAVIGLLFFLIADVQRVPRSVIILDPILLLVMMGGSRFFYRALREHKLYGLYSKKGEPVVLLGAGEAAISLLKDLAQSEQWRVVAILDDNKSMHGREIQGMRVYGSMDVMGKVVAQYGVRHVIIAMPSAQHQDRRKALELANQLGLEALTVPSIDDLISGRLSVSQIRPVDVEDLLGRDVVDLDDSGLKELIKGNTILITGAAGSIGSELCRQIFKFNPSYLICLDISEYSLYKLEQELSKKNLSVKTVFVVGDIKHAARIDKILAQYMPKVVFHAAAYKHVPLMEIENVSEALNNNVLGTYILAKACKKAKIEKFVLISTDKAVNPTNVMGASKRLAEMTCQGLQNKNGTRFVIVRFGNVLGSSGSVIPKFREQIKAGGPITITHPEINRYFMSIPEAAQLVMQAGLMGQGGEIFVLDMGAPIKIIDLAKDMIKLSGFSENEIKIEFTGLRPGEKLYEELLANDEQTIATTHKKLRIALAKTVEEKWVNSLLKWIEEALGKDELLIKKELKIWAAEYQGDIHAR